MKKRHAIILFLATSILLILPVYLPKYYVFIITMAFCYAIYALGFNILLGYTGLLSFGHALYWGVGAYTVAAFMRPELGPYRVFSMEALLLLGVATSFLVATCVGALIVRYTRIFFGLLNMGFVMLWYSLLLKLYYVTGGTDGLHVYTPSLLGQAYDYEFFRVFAYYYYVLAAFGITTFIMWRIVNSHFGLVLKSLRENSLRARFVGIPVEKYRLASYIISGVWGGIGGALWAPLSGQVSPEISNWLTSGDVVFMTVLGGMHTFIGPIIGAFVLFNLKVQIMHFTTAWPLVLGLSVILMILLLPEGITGTLLSAAQKLRKKPIERARGET